MASRMVEIANGIGQLETNIVTERTAGMHAEQHVQTLTAPVVDFDKQPDNPTQLTVLVDTKVWEKAWQAGRICDGWVERLGAGHALHRTVQH